MGDDVMYHTSPELTVLPRRGGIPFSDDVGQSSPPAAPLVADSSSQQESQVGYASQPATPDLRRSSRQRQEPTYLRDYVLNTKLGTNSTFIEK
ncbi:hypothetical protein GE061_011910 [Apolygus lucorum]|uniref:Uncharacterized protein n=1 Tax=Apolygus lucorum TaxID=248454 RepID=A0A8S9XT36_APOLU|nr:hypothetical protein GE061_011910 [Apolygus lucorum]